MAHRRQPVRQDTQSRQGPLQVQGAVRSQSPVLCPEGKEPSSVQPPPLAERAEPKDIELIGTKRKRRTHTGLRQYHSLHRKIRCDAYL